jgi:hypothetical protein
MKRLATFAAGSTAVAAALAGIATTTAAPANAAEQVRRHRLVAPRGSLGVGTTGEHRAAGHRPRDGLLRAERRHQLLRNCEPGEPTYRPCQPPRRNGASWLWCN